MSNVHVTDSQYITDFLFHLAAGKVEGIDPNFYTMCRSWDWQKDCDFTTIGLNEDAAEFAEAYMQLTGGELVYPGTRAEEAHVRLPLLASRCAADTLTLAVRRGAF